MNAKAAKPKPPVAGSGAPVHQLDRQPLFDRSVFDLSDYGFQIDGGLAETFDIIPSRMDDEEMFLFIFPRDDLAGGPFSLFNLHCFLKRTGSLDDFGHSLGPSVADIPFEDWKAFGGVAARGYDRRITMGELFSGAPEVIDFIGGRPDLEVRDSHVYFRNRHAHCYTGLLQESPDNAKYDAMRESLFAGIKLV